MSDIKLSDGDDGYLVAIVMGFVAAAVWFALWVGSTGGGEGIAQQKKACERAFIGASAADSLKIILVQPKCGR